MRYQKISSKGSNPKNINLISRHIHEISNLLRQKNDDKDIEYEKLRLKQYQETSVLNFYRHLYDKSVQELNNKDTLHGYVPLKNIEFICDENSMKGTIFAFENNKIFLDLLKIDLNRKLKDKDHFYNILHKSPVPFIFLPECDLEYFQNFVNVFQSNDSISFSKIIYGQSQNMKVLLLDPFTMLSVDLGFLVNDFVSDSNIVCFLYGFLYE